ncbi:hypothetical protein ABPG74_002642 [Tetrahymena malaccensis]
MEFEDKPIGGTKFVLDEYPPGYDPNAKKEEPQEKLPLQTRIKSTVFKNRKEAIEELIELFKKTEDVNDPVFSEYTPMFSKFVSDSNPACLEKGLQAIQIWCEKMESLSSLSEPQEFLKLTVEKALSQGKQNITDIIYEIFSIFIEKGQKDDVLNSLKICFPHKNQKVQCCSIQAVLEILKRFGARKLDYLKQFLPEIQKLSEVTISGVKAACMTFFKEAFKWLGEGMKIFTDKLSRQQLEELEKFYADYKEEEPLKPTRESALKEEQDLAKGGKGKVGTKIDAYDMAIAQDIFTKFNEAWTEKVLATQKWSEKKELLDALIKAASVPKLAPTNYYPIVQMCKKLLNDSNVNIQVCAIKIVGLLASGLRKQFSQSAKLLSSQIVEKFKDKKQFIVDEALKTLKNYFYCITLDELVEDLKEALNDKNAGSKLNAINLLINCIEDEKYKNTFKLFFQQLRKLLDDSSEDVRNKTIQLVGKLKGYYTDSYTQSITLNLNQQKMSKIDQYASQVQPFQSSEMNTSQLGSQMNDRISPPKPASGGAALKKNTTNAPNNNNNNSTNNNKFQKIGLQPASTQNGNKGNTSMEIESDNIQSLQNSNPNARMDISKELEKPLRKIQEQKQQSKKEGLDILEVLLQQANYKISSNGISELVIALKKCLSESNKSLVRQFISFVAKFGEALGKEAKLFAKTLVPGIMQNLSDKQALVRTEAQNALEKWAELIGIEQIINFIPPFLGYESLEIKNELMNYIIKNSESYLKSDLKSFTVPILQRLTDKTKEIRTLAEQILEITLQVFPISHFYDSVKDFKPAVVQQLRLIFEKYSGGKPDQGVKTNQINEEMNTFPQQNNPYNTNKLQLENNMNQNVYNPQRNHNQARHIQQQAPAQLNTQTLKEKRNDMEEQRPWPLETIHDDLVEDLIENFRQVGIPNELRMKMFSYNSASVIEAAKYVKEKISSASQISDILIKWVYLRLWEQRNIEVCKIILEMQKQIFDCLKGEQYYLADFELNIILSSMYLCMELHSKSSEILNLIVSAHERLRLICSSSKIMKFWVNRLQVNSSFCELIILVLNSGLFTSELSNELGTLSKIEAIAQNQDIVTALLNTYGDHVMKAYGFQLKSNQLQNVKQEQKTNDQGEDQGFLEIKQNLYKLGNKDINLKLYTVHFLNEAFQNPEKIQIMIKHSDLITLEITKYLSTCMIELKQKEIQYEFFNSFMNLFIKITNTKQFFCSISPASTKNVAETILTELIQADENKEDKNSQQAVKQLNTLMLRVLENGEINNMLQILFDLLIFYRRKSEYSKYIAIIIRCILKLAKVLRDDIKEVNLDSLFIKFHQYISEFNHENQRSDDIGVKAVKTMIDQIAKAVDIPVLMQHYKVLESQPIKDQQIIKMIEIISNTTTIHQSPLTKATPVAGGIDKMSQLKMRYAQMLANKSPNSQIEEESVQRSIQRLNNSIQQANNMPVLNNITNINQQNTNENQKMIEENNQMNDQNQKTNLFANN